MTTIELPARIDPIPELEAGAESKSVTDAFRGAATALSDVRDWTAEHGAPGGWEGSDADAADHAMTQLSRRVDIASAAMDKATVACDTYVTAMVREEDKRPDLVSDRTTLNSDIDDLEHRINGASEDAVGGLKAEAAALRTRATGLLARIVAWEKRISSAETTFIRALQSVDSTSEGITAADASGRVDTSALAKKLESFKDPDAANSWWESLTPAQREALKISDPDIVGNTNGLPTGDRDDANRASMTRDLNVLLAKESAGEPLTAAEKQQLEIAKKTRESLDLALTKTDPVTGVPVDGNLLVYSPTSFNGDGAVAVSYGDPDTADNTAVVVPGLTNDGTKIASQGEDAMNLYLNSQAKGDSTAAIAWMGYDAPSATGDGGISQATDFLGVGQEDKAEAGGRHLSDFVDGLRASDQGGQSHLTVIGHSYGSTTAAHAATDGLDADKLVLIGSPGAGGGSEHVRDLNMPEGSVYVGAAENDPVTWLGRDADSPDESQYLYQNGPIRIENPLYGPGGLGMGEDPSQSTFGAKRFSVDDGPELDVETMGSDGFEGTHSSYLDQNSTSLDNISTIVQGNREPDLVEGRSREANDYLTGWARDEVDEKWQEHVVQPFEERVVQPIEHGIEATKNWTGDRVNDVQEGAGQARRWADDRVDDFKDLWPG